MVDHPELPGDKEDSRDEGKWVPLPNAATHSKRVTISVAKFDCAYSVNMKVMPRAGEVLRKASVYEQIPCESGVERIEKLVIIVRRHGSVQAVEQRVLEVALGVPRGLDWLASSDSSTEAWMRVLSQPRPELVKPSAGFDAVDRAVHGK